MKISATARLKKDLINRVIVLTLLFIVLVFALVYIVSLNLSLGWFASNKDVSASGMSVVAHSDKFDILINRTTEFDTMLPGDIPKYENVSDFKSELSGDYSFTATSTGNANGIAYELVNEVAYSEGGNSYEFLMPGSCGTITFYLRPKTADDISLDFNLTVDCFKKVIDGMGYSFEKVEEQLVNDLIKGHILLFTERRGANVDSYKYNGLITSGTLHYDTSENTKCTDPGKTDCYKIMLYWEWPALYSVVNSEISATAWEKRYPSELRTYINNNRGYFFAANQNSNDIQDLDDGYNDADQIIGEYANIMAISVTYG
ncbi:MAG: hypothetical protein J5852_01115 [Clostridia bacterium]|nr:hypothetical protein [Clostridia bacterium]